MALAPITISDDRTFAHEALDLSSKDSFTPLEFEDWADDFTFEEISQLLSSLAIRLPLNAMQLQRESGLQRSSHAKVRIRPLSES
jgi:hypothetical protein